MDDQVTEAHYSNAHQIAKERRFSYLSYCNHKKHQSVIRYSRIYQFNGVNELDMEGRVQLVNMMTAIW